MTIDIEPLRKELGRKIEEEDVVTQAPIKAMLATFDREEKVPEPGEPIAPGWHLLYLHSYARRDQLGRDGAAGDLALVADVELVLQDQFEELAVAEA